VTSRRSVALITAAAVVGAAVLVGLGVAGALRWISPGRGCDIPASLADQAGAPPSAAPGGGEIQVLEQGFTANINGGVSVGAILTNTSRSVAYQLHISYRLVDASSRPLQAADPAEVIPILLPGQRIGVGEFIPSAAANRVSGFQVVLGDPQWRSMSVLGKDFTTVAGTYQQLTHDATPVATLSFTEKSANCRDLAASTVAVVFRNAGGAIVGGATEFPQGGGSESCAQGSSTVRVQGLVRPPTTQDARTQVYPYCDVMRHPLPETSG